MGKSRRTAATRAIEQHKRRRNVENAVLRGHTNARELAVRYGVSYETINKDIHAIREGWANSYKKAAKYRRLKRIKQLEEVFRNAMDSYERSRKDEEELQTKYTPQRCRDCAGVGKVEEVECAACQGTGKIIIESTVRRIRGQAGDAAFLGQARGALMDIAKLEGLTVSPQSMRIKQAVVVQQQMAAVGVADDANPFMDVPKDVLLDAREALLRLRQAKLGGTRGEDREGNNGEADGGEVSGAQDAGQG